MRPIAMRSRQSGTAADGLKRSRKFVMTGYFERGFRLAHDIESDKKLELWKRFESEGRRGGDFREYLKQHYKPETAGN